MEVSQSVVAFLLTGFFCFVGIPVWWQTTKVYRASLPYNEITSLAITTNSTLTFGLQWNIFIDEQLLRGNSSNITLFKNTLSLVARDRLPMVNLQMVYKIIPDFFMANVTKADGRSIQDLVDVINEKVENRIKQSELKPNGHELFHHGVTFMKIPLLVSNGLRTDRALLFGTSNVIILINTLEPDELEKNIKWIVYKMQEILFPKFMMYTDIGKEKYDSEWTSLQSSSGFDMSFTLVNENPFDSLIDWNIEEAIGNELVPILQRLSDFGPFSITSQILNFVDVGMQPKKLKDGGYFYSLKKLPLLINPLESHLNEYTSNNPILNFILYIPQTAHMPLMFRDKGMPFMSFTSPKWGSVIIKNLIHPDVFENETVNDQWFDANRIRVESEMKIIVSHFRELIGLKRTVDEVFFASVDKTGVAKWEINYLLLKGTMENLQKSISNLVSLAALLEKISNIVIKGDIRNLLEQAIQQIKESMSFLIDRKLRRSFLASKLAVMSSEKAFYDHSLLALLYFPDDQKYAIYLPLFFPIIIPLCMSFTLAIKTCLVSYKT